MSEVNEVLNNGQQAIINFDISKIFIFGNRYNKAVFTNDTYDPLTLPGGTLMGRVAATGEIIPCASGASDGSQFPIGILAQEIEIEDGDSHDLLYCHGGDVVAEKIIFDGSDDLDTIVDGRQLRDHLTMMGINVIEGTTEMTSYDNQ